MDWKRSLFWFSILLMVAIPGNAQVKKPRQPPPGEPGGADINTSGGPDENRARLAIEQAKKDNLARQHALKADTDKLLQLATELKESVDKSNANVLSVDVVKKAEEIEKLAKSVKDKMKGPN